MGNCNSGRWYCHNKKRVVGDCVILKSDLLNDSQYFHGVREWFHSGGWLGTVKSKYGEMVSFSSFDLADKDDGGIILYTSYFKTNDSGYRYPKKYLSVDLAVTTLFSGGLRVWWKCPQCGKRVRNLYSPPGPYPFACRECHDLTYKSCQESHNWRERFFAQMGAKFGASAREMQAVWDEN